MKIAFVVNSVKEEDKAYTTTRLAFAAHRRDHQVWELGVGDFIYDSDGSIKAFARSAPPANYENQEDYLAAIQSEDVQPQRISVDELDVLMLRNDPADDAVERPWAATSAILFAHLAVRNGVIVVNDPVHLANAVNKTYFQHFPEEVRPKTCISRDRKEIKNFIEEQKDKVVIKPLQGSGGQSVFLMSPEDEANHNQMIDAVIRDGYAIVQEYLPEAEHGDIRLFLMNGRPLMRDGKYAAFRRVNSTKDMRSNMHAGGTVREAELDERALLLAEMVRPKLVADGMFLVGLDIVGDKLMEINVFSPGGLGSAQGMTGVDFADVVIEDLERKVKYRNYYGSRIDNVQLATL